MLDNAPRAIVAHQQMQDLVLVALIAGQRNPEAVLQRFRALVHDLAADEPAAADDETFITAVQRSAARFDRLLQLVLPAIVPEAREDNSDRRLPGLQAAQVGERRET